MSDNHGDLERLSLSSTRIGDTLLQIASYSSATEHYQKVIRDFLGPTVQIPNLSEDGIISPMYGSLSDGKVAVLMACCNGIAQCEKRLGRLEEALLWLDEVKVLYLNVHCSPRDFVRFIWEGYLYVAGGRQDSLGPFYRDIFAVNLQTLDGWRSLPAYPHSFNVSGVFLGWHMIPCSEHKRAYLFTGRPALDYLDLTTKTWGSVRTTISRNDPADRQAGIQTLPYPDGHLTDSTQGILEEKLYVFGGTHGKTNIGCNLFMVLDLKTFVWTRLSGSVMPPRESDGTPGPRKTPSSWVDPTAKKFCLLFGECDRTGAALKGEMHGGHVGWSFDDFWTWDIAKKKWSRERITGNAPCPRSEVAYVYNPVFKKTIIWGGYNADLPTFHEVNGMNFGFSYYADTFICDSSPRVETEAPQTNLPRRWKQVLTKGFPTYRAQAQLKVDPSNGRTYLFGGFTNNDYVPSRKTAISRSFGDVWELRIDIPGGHFEGVNIADEARTAQPGPWQRCFTCGSAGDWRKCGGSCRGRAFFCDAECRREGWKDHKAAHGCRKVD